MDFHINIKIRFLHFHPMIRYWFYGKNHFRNFHQIFTFREGFFESVCLFVRHGVCWLYCALAYFLRARKENTSSLTNYFWPMVPVLSIKKSFWTNKKFHFPAKIYDTKKILNNKIVRFKKTYKLWSTKYDLCVHGMRYIISRVVFCAESKSGICLFLARQVN